MTRGRDLIPRSFFQFPSSALSSFPALWEEMGEKMNQWMGATGRVTVSENDNEVHIEAQLPGLQKEDIDISLHHNTLIIQGEKREEEEAKEKRFHRRAQRSFYYEVELPATVEENAEQAEYENGVLILTFQKTTKSNIRKIPIRNNSKSQGQQIQKQQQPTQKQAHKK
jgi:HSP20 family protein